MSPIIFLFFLAQLGAQENVAHQAPLGEQIESFARPLVERHDFSGAFAIRGPEGPVSVAVGFADLAHDVRNSVDTRFGIGSVSKQFTAALALRLIEDGQLTLQDVAQDILPGLSGPAVTVHQLLAHRSGLARDPLAFESQGKQFDRSELLDIISSLPREFAPGERTSYSNSGYIVLALIAESVSGMRFCDLLHEEVLEPLGLQDTGCLSTSSVIPKLAQGYDPGLGPYRLRASPFLEWSNLTGPGGLYSTVEDLAQWGQVMLDRTFLSPSSWEAFMTDHGNGRGYGIAQYTRHGHRAIGHDGVINGYTAFLEIYPENRSVVAYAGNIRAGAFELMENAVIGLTLGAPVNPPEAPSDLDTPVSFEEGAPVTGRYELFPGFHLTITWEADRLFLSGTGGYPTVLTTKADGDYFYRAMYATVRFEIDGENQELIWIDRGGQEYRAQRTSIH
ncbi:MAG: beta-lactamase family protein [Gemmatimonadetes bacterium]|nr:beta-lactamase family protein [Gemmatimonadota bacterium]NNM04597.1 beta-lactamase family protein [Gemmatimonadota bacterium]